MNRLTTFIAAIIVAITAYGSASYVRDQAQPRERYTAVVAEAAPTVVTIYVTYRTTDTANVERSTILGSGVYISPKGHILTCAHLFDDGGVIETVLVEDYNGDTRRADGLSIDPRKDLALIKVNVKDGPYAVVARPGVITVGQEVVAIGAPIGLSGTVTTGVVSALHRDEINYDMLQMSAPINPGNSGGPLFNLKGEVVGINVNIMLATPLPIWSGIGYSVSASEINKFLVDFANQFKGLERI